MRAHRGCGVRAGQSLGAGQVGVTESRGRCPVPHTDPEGTGEGRERHETAPAPRPKPPTPYQGNSCPSCAHLPCSSPSPAWSCPAALPPAQHCLGSAAMPVPPQLQPQSCPPLNLPYTRLMTRIMVETLWPGPRSSTCSVSRADKLPMAGGGQVRKIQCPTSSPPPQGSPHCPPSPKG